MTTVGTITGVQHITTDRFRDKATELFSQYEKSESPDWNTGYKNGILDLYKAFVELGE